MQPVQKSLTFVVLTLLYVLCFGTKTVAQSCTPIITISGSPSLCAEGETTLTATQAASYKWSNGAATQSITVTEAATYTVTTTTEDGCTATSAPLQISDRPDATIKDPLYDFTYCSYTGSANSFKLEVENASTTAATNTGYTISWGDGKSSALGTDFERTSHTYTAPGLYTITVTATDASGCQGTFTEKLFIGSNPGLGITSDGNNIDCAPVSYGFKITGVEGNSPHTVYTFQFDDGTAPYVFKHNELPADRILRHEFLESSKDKPNGFTLTGTAINQCNKSIATFTGIRISKGPIADFAIGNVCLNEPVRFQDKTKNGYDASARTDRYRVQWEIFPATGWKFTSGNGTTLSPNVVFNELGEYMVRLTAYPLDPNSTCLPTVMEQMIVVNDVPKAAFELTPDGGVCAPSIFRAQNNSTGADLKYTWTVSATEGWSFAEGTDANSENPVFSFDKSGTYTVSLLASSFCSAVSTQETNIVVIHKPLATLPEAQTYCGPQTIAFSADNAAHRPVYDAQSGTISAYRWEVSGPGSATFESGTHAGSAFPTLRFTEPGTYEVKVIATNECGDSEEATQQITIDAIPVLELNAPKEVVCLNSGIMQLEASHAGGVWSGSEYVSADGQFNPAAVGSYTLTYTYRAGVCEVSETIAVTVNDLPAAPTVQPVTILCPGTPALLQVLQAEGSVQWYDQPTGGNLLHEGNSFQTSALDQTTIFYAQTTVEGGCSSVRTPLKVEVYPATPAPMVAPVTLCGAGSSATLIAEGNAGAYEWFADAAATQALETGRSFTAQNLPEGTSTFYVRGVTNGCYSPVVAATVTILPALDRNTLKEVATICAGQSPALLTGTAPTGGNGSYTYQWEASVTDAEGGFEVIAGASAATYQPGTLNRTIWFRRTVLSAGCSHTSAPIAVTVTPVIDQNTVTAIAPICEGAEAPTLKGSEPIGGTGSYAYTWEFSTTGVNGSFKTPPSGFSGKDYAPGVLNETTWFRRKVTSGTCQVHVSEAVKVTVVKPITMNFVSVQQGTICSGSTPSVIIGSMPQGGTDQKTYRWEMRSESGSFEPALGTNSGLNYTPQINDKTMWYRRVVTGGPCGESVSNEIQILVQPAIEQNTIQIAGQPVICEGTAAATLTGALPTGGNGSYTYRWLYSTAGPSATFSPAPGSNASQHYTSPTALTQTTWYIREVVSGECISNSDVVEVTVVGLPAAPQVAPVTVCEGSSATLTVNSHTTNTFRWYANASAQEYLFEGYSFETEVLQQTTTFFVEAVNVNGCGSSERLPVTVTVNKRINSNSLTAPSAPICAGQRPNVLTGTTPSGGNGSYTYQWESSVTGADVGFSPVAGATGATYQPEALEQTTWFRRVVLSGPCEAHTSVAVKVDVLPAISNNTITVEKGTICAGDVLQQLKGAVPAGGNGSYTYLWESSRDGQHFTAAAGTNNQPDYQAPAPLTERMWYRRVVYSAPCQQAVSPVLEIVVQPVITNNTITTQSHSVCAGDTPSELKGTRPTGGNEQPVYLWESRTESTDFAPAAGNNTSMNYQPGQLTETTWFRRKVVAGECYNTSAEVRILVNAVISNNTISADQVICTGTAPAKLTGSQPGGGTGSYTFYWEAAGNDGVFRKVNNSASADLNVGILTTTTSFRRVVESGPCQHVSNVVTVTVSPVISNNTIGLNQSIFRGQTPAPLSGTNPSGGAGAGTYTYLWESSLSQQGGYQPAAGINNGRHYTPSALHESTWFRRRVFSGGCETTSDPVLIEVHKGVTNNNIYSDQVICAGNKPATLQGSVPVGGDGNFLYLWLASTKGSKSGFMTATGQSTGKDYSPAALTQSTWLRRVVLSGPTPDTSAAVFISVRPPMANNRISTSQTICYGTAPSLLVGTLPTGGSGNYNYSWESSTSGPDNGYTIAAGVNNGKDFQSAALTQSTWFRRVVTSESCERLVSEAIKVTVTPLPDMPVASGQTICHSSKTTLNATGKGGRLEWFSQAKGGNPIHVGNSFTTPILTSTTTYYVQEVASSCASERRSVTVTVPAPSANAGMDQTLMLGRTVQLQATGGATYSWSPAEGLNNPNIANPYAKPEKTTTYTVTVTNEAGCVSTDEVTITVQQLVYVPNTFTPNHDGVNDVWEILNIEQYPNCKVQVFNQWGNTVFSSQGYKLPWDGRQNGKELPIATYYYLIQLDNQEKPLSGSVTIVK
ncbi:gliding motility-associated C-terminal domain-containing protein [Pontibacter sp. FD36]|uniref:Ig-like domain-containing protein n=1 Tax=Pontibacter sp. FD36 TaxID=2789860 RepID=UPI0018ABCD38|nr:gliding motility-associated C-terminal domain-containing protein [Pontibacter sp. FD36]MBF8962858.1 gliding motility-associated C-terminal domain-containing protein [Pontibacter sp. FD36]